MFSAINTFSFTGTAVTTFTGSWEEEKPVEDTGIELGEIIAWRAWRVEHDWLYSMVADEEWQPGEIKKAHVIGQVLGDGIHAFKQRRDAINNYGREPNVVVGQIQLWGTVYEFEKGWHGEYARVQSLDWISKQQRRNKKLTDLRALYQC